MNRIIRYSSLATVLLSCIVLNGCDKSAKAEAAAPNIPEVGVYTVKEEILPVTVDLPGRATAYRVSEVRPQINGIVQQRLFIEGADVKKDQPLYHIDEKPYLTQLDKAKASFNNAQQLTNRYHNLLKTHAISQQEYDDVLMKLRQAKADMKQAEIDLEYTRVLSPISGKVGRSLVSEGSLVNNGQAQPLTIITQLDPIYFDITQPISDQLKLQQLLQQGVVTQQNDKKATVELFLEDGSRYPQTGLLNFSEVHVEPSTGSVTLRAEFPNKDHHLLPGMYAKARLVEGTHQNAKLVPQQAITRDARGKAVAFVIDDNQTLQIRDVETLKAQGNTWLIGKGLQAGDRVMTEGHHRAKPGMKVKAVPANNVSLQTSFE